MEEILSKMNPEKRICFINAALEEFGKNDYDKASTNVIVKNAGISKGLLYHYFKNKEELYNYLVEFLFEKYSKDILDHIDFTKSDILERISHTIKYKMETFKIYPGIISFAKNFYARKSIKELTSMVDKYSPGYYERFFQENIDYGKFKDGVDIQKVMKITQWSLEKFSEEKVMILKEDIDIDLMYKELNEYLDTLRIAFYKREENK